MHLTRRALLNLAACVAGLLASLLPMAQCVAGSAPEPQTQQPATQNPAAGQVVGAIKAINGTTITLTTDAGSDVSVLLQDSARIVRVAPGQTDLKGAVPLQLSDLQVSDRILVRGKPSDDGKSFQASGVIAMRRADVDAKQAHDREDWQKRGIGGLVSAVDAGTGTISISVAGAGGTRSIALHTTKETVIRRYAPESLQFDDAKPSVFTQIKPGDQLRARGTRAADGTDFVAEEIVSGSFRNISGTINAVDTTASTLTVMDLATKKPVLVRVTSQSQIFKLPAQVAQGIALRLKGTPAGTPSDRPNATGGGGAAGTGAASGTGRQGGGDQRAGGGVGGAGGAGGNARPGGVQADLQQIVSRMPPNKLADLQKGDAVMIVSTEGTNSGGVTAITLLGGVEPILTASPKDGQAMTLSPWSLGGGGGGGDAGEATP